MTSSFVLLRLSGKDEEDALSGRLGLPGHPFHLVLDSKGDEVDWILGNDMPLEKFRDHLLAIAQGKGSTVRNLLRRAESDTKDVEAAFLLAQKFSDRSPRVKSIEYYKKVIALDPQGRAGTILVEGQPVSWTQFAEFTLAELATWAQAPRDLRPLKAFLKKTLEGPLAKAGYRRLAQSYSFGTGTAAEADGFFAEFASRYPEDPEALNSWATRLLRDNRNPAKAIALSEKALGLVGRSDPRTTALANLARLHAGQSDLSQAGNVYGSDFLEMTTNEFAYRLLNFAGFWIEKNAETETALTAVETVVRMLPDNVNTLQQAADLFWRTGREERAREVFGPGFLAKNGDKPGVVGGYARFWANKKTNLESALEAARKQISQGQSAYSFDTLAAVLFALGRVEEAIAAEEKALTLTTNTTTVETYKKRLDQYRKSLKK